jgi:prepilin-type N-terminal cleavage/methylation domain-containing protein
MSYRFSQAGFSLLEMIIVLAIAATGMSIAVFNFHSFDVKTNTESQVKQMAVDLDQMRLRALATKKRQGVKLTEFSYSFYSYSSLGDGAGALTGGACTVNSSLLSALPVTKFNGAIFQIDERGMLIGSNTQTIFFGNTDVGSVNCVVLSAARVSAGKRNASGGCDAQ